MDAGAETASATAAPVYAGLGLAPDAVRAVAAEFSAADPDAHRATNRRFSRRIDALDTLRALVRDAQAEGKFELRVEAETRRNGRVARETVTIRVPVAQPKSI
jgi:hypothetical protein